MKHTIIFSILSILSFTAISQSEEVDNLWVTGTAIPGHIVQLKKASVEGCFRYTGKLLQGEFKIITTATISSATSYYIPSEEDANGVGNNIPFSPATDAVKPGFKITYTDTGDCYKLTVDIKHQSLNCELYKAPQNIYIVGGATAVGWNRIKAIPLEKDAQDPNIFTFKGKLKINDKGEERNSFKFLPYMSGWGPPSYHPVTANEPLIGSRYVVQRNEKKGPDYKWIIANDQQGDYVIKLNLLEETIDAKFIQE